MAVVAINIGEIQVRAAVIIPAAPVMAIGAAVKWASDRFGPVAWVILGVLIGGGIYWYRKQPPGRRKRIKQVVGEIGTHLLEEVGTAADGVHRARVMLRGCLVPRPDQRTPASAILRELALSTESLSAQQLAELLDPSVRPPVADLRAFLRAHDDTVFQQVRRGVVIGSRYRLSG